MLHTPAFRTLVATMLAFTFLASASAAAPLVSGDLIPAGAPDGRSPLAIHAINSLPLGVAKVFGSEQPDLFVRSTKFGHEPGLFLFPWVATADDGTPVFGTRIPVSYPFGGKFPPNGTIFQTGDGVVHGIWIVSGKLAHTVYDKEERAFTETGRITLRGLPRGPRTVGVLPNPDGTVEVLLGISDGVKGRHDEFSSRDPRYQPYDGAGIWRGGLSYEFLYAVTLPRMFEGPAAAPRLVSATEREVQGSYQHLTVVNLGPGHERGILGGSRHGGLHYYENAAAQGLGLQPRLHAVRRDGNAHRHPTIWACPTAYPNPPTGLSDLIAGGEGGLHFYAFTGAFTDAGKPIYEDPRPALEQDADLYAGSLAVPTVADWDGDGQPDIIAGNSEGRVQFFRNVGAKGAPAFLPGVSLEAGGYPIHVQPGYRLDIQGPGEARWGYTCPTVADWNGDGLPDILMSDSTARHTVFLNRGTRTQPRLALGHPLYLDGLDMHGTWRVKPAAAKLGNRMAYVALDDDDQFHLHWRIDDYNTADGGKLCLEDGSVIGANFLHAGGTGRLKLNLTDWDRDGLIDLIVGTPRHGSVPNPDKGLPQSLGLPGSSVLFLRNVATNTAPAFAFPEVMHAQGKPIFLGQHSCGPTPADFGNPLGPDLIIGTEEGRFLFYARKDLSHTSPSSK